jgi:hypothetical protein
MANPVPYYPETEINYGGDTNEETFNEYGGIVPRPTYRQGIIEAADRERKRNRQAQAERMRREQEAQGRAPTRGGKLIKSKKKRTTKKKPKRTLKRKVKRKTNKK